MTGHRQPAAFRVEPEENREKPRQNRKAKAVKLDKAVVITPAQEDFFAGEDLAQTAPLPVAPRRRSRFGALFFTALGILVSLAIGLWTDRLIRDLFSRADWLGWFALGVAAIAALALLVIVLREFLALSRLTSFEGMRAKAADAFARNDAKAAKKTVSGLVLLLSGKPETAAGRQALDALKGEIIDGADLLRVAEKELLAPLDDKAKKLVLDAAKRVSVVTALSPRALVDVAYVIFESARLARRLAELYGGRPGFLGFLRLTRNILAHLAVTGSMAAGETLVQQVVGHGLAARLSARLGEGVVNGMMTARIGIAAMDAVRPLAFNALPRPGMGDFLKALTRFSAAKSEQEKPRD